MNIFLRLKHWHLFTILVVIPLAIRGARIYLATMMPLGEMFTVLQVLSFVGIAVTIVATCWMWAVGTRLADKRPDDDLNNSFFKIAVLGDLASIVLTSVILRIMGFYDEVVSWGVAVIVYLLRFYCYYFIAKVLNSVERDREMKFGDVLGDFFALIFYPIGIWWIQPRINKIFNGDTSIDDTVTPLDQFR